MAGYANQHGKNQGDDNRIPTRVQKLDGGTLVYGSATSSLTPAMEGEILAFKKRASFYGDFCRLPTQHVTNSEERSIIEGWIEETDISLKIARSRNFKVKEVLACRQTNRYIGYIYIHMPLGSEEGSRKRRKPGTNCKCNIIVWTRKNWQ